MFEIDLLKGKARPYRTNLKRVVMGMVLLLIPIGATMAYAVELFSNRIELSTMRHTLAINEAQLAHYADDMRFVAELKGHINDVSLFIADVGQILRYRLVASAVLAELAKQLPPNIFLQEMDWNRALQRDEIPGENGAPARSETVVQRSLKLSLCGSEDASSDTAVQAYMGSLSASPALVPLVREIRPAARSQREVEGKNVTVYEIELYLKDQR